jgi:HSP20 family protein
MVKNLIPWKRKREALSPVKESDQPFEVLHRQMNDLFDTFFSGLGSPRGGPALGRFAGGWPEESPRFEVSETEEEIQVKAELPGMDEKDIEVTLDESSLTIRGEKKEEREEKKRSYVLSEVSYGQFHRTLPLPSGIERDKVKARFKKGVLTLTLPKSETARRFHFLLRWSDPMNDEAG